MEITPRELRDVEIRDSIRGYHRDDVNDLLERAAATIQADVDRIGQLTERLAAAQSEAGRAHETEDVLHRTLLLAQRAADETVAEATAKSRQTLDDAEIQARRLVADAEAEARSTGETERRRLEEEVLDLAGRREALLADVEALTRFEADYRERMVRALEADLSALRLRPTTAPGARPEPSEVELPEVDEDVVIAEPVESVVPPAPEVEPAPAAPAQAVIEPEAEPSDPPAHESMSTHEVDVRSLFESSQATPAVTDEPVATNGAATDEPVATNGAATHAPQADEQHANNGVVPDVLDDDAFFATLRDAVHDEAPLGPREDGDDITGEQRFFDQDADRGGFRDVFRRRR